MLRAFTVVTKFVGKPEFPQLTAIAIGFLPRMEGANNYDVRQLVPRQVFCDFVTSLPGGFISHGQFLGGRHWLLHLRACSDGWDCARLIVAFWDVSLIHRSARGD